MNGGWGLWRLECIVMVREWWTAGKFPWNIIGFIWAREGPGSLLPPSLPMTCLQ